MKELSLNILDIANNSLTAGATLVEILLLEDENKMLTLTIRDDGCGMSEQLVNDVINPFCTSRKTREVGLGIPLLRLAAQQTGGDIKITSTLDNGMGNEHGTTVTATFDMSSIDFTPLGDVTSTVCALIQGHPQVDFEFSHKTPDGEVSLSTRQMREILGGDVPLNSFEVICWIKDYLNEQYDNMKNNILGGNYENFS